MLVEAHQMTTCRNLNAATQTQLEKLENLRVNRDLIERGLDHSVFLGVLTMLSPTKITD